MNTLPSASTASIPNSRRDFLGHLGLGSMAAALAGGLGVTGFAADLKENRKPWQPKTERKLRFGIVGYGVCRFGAEFGFQFHPHVEIVAVSDLFPERRAGLMKACRCSNSYDSLEELVK